MRRRKNETIGDVVDRLEAGKLKPTAPGLWLPFGLRLLTVRQFRRELSGASEIFTEVGQALGAATVARRYGLELRPEDLRLSGGLQLYPPHPEQMGK